MVVVAIDNISYAILPLKEIPYNNSFTRLELSNYSSKLEEIPVAIIDENYIANVTSKVFQVQGEILDIIEFDEQPTEYRIQVYTLNKETGYGGIYLYYSDVIRVKMPIRLKGRMNYEHTQFSKNFDEGGEITVKAIAKKVNGEIKELTYTFD